MKPRFRLYIQLILLCLAVGLAYSPAFRAEPCLLDDLVMLKGLQDDAPLDLKGLLALPSTTRFTYTRPLLAVSYWCSQTFWNANPQAMHTENVVFHLLNVLLLFWLIRLSLTGDEQSNSFIPFLGALLFALHPIATESVNWISGRTDLIAGACLLGTTIALVKWRNNRNRWWLFLSALLLLAGAIKTKEVAWGFVLILPFFLAVPYDSATHTFKKFLEAFSRIEKLLFLTAIALSYLLAAVILSFWPVVALSAILGLIVLYKKQRLRPLPKTTYLLLTVLLVIAGTLLPFGAKLAHQSTAGISSNFTRTLLLISLDFDNSMGLFSAALAFYLKKFFLPLPLSFSIGFIASEYLFGGIAIIILTAFLIAWRSRAAILFLAGIAVLLPALPLVHNQIAWAPYAERYIYISTSFWIASLAVAFSSVRQPSLRTIYSILCLLVIPASALITYKRSKTWQTNVTLFEDTTLKSPKNHDVRTLYMTALSQSGRLVEALKQYRLLQADDFYTRVKYINILAKSLYAGGLKQEAWEVLETTMAKPLGRGRVHPLGHEEWQQLYKLHEKVRLELFPQKQSRLKSGS